MAVPTKAFPGQPQPNPKGHVNAIILQSGTELDESVDPRLQNPTMYQNSGKGIEKVNEPTNDLKEDKNGEAEDKETPYVPPPPYIPPIPYPQRLTKSKNEGQFKKFVELLKQLNITIPFTESITQMPSYAKLLEEILFNKKKFEDNETYMLTTKCNSTIQNNMPPKLKDPSSFSIPCVIEKLIIGKALCGLGANVSLMPLSTCKKLNLGELRPTKMSLQLANHSVKFPIGRPFLATAGTIIDVKKGKLTFEVREEKVEFILAQFLQVPSIEDSCCLLDVIDKCVKEIEREPFKYIEVLKGYSGFFQIPIHPDDQENTTFTCPYGMFAYRRMSFGLCNAPATFQRCMISIFADFIDDIMEGIVLGHVVSDRGIKLDKAKIEIIENLQPPKTVREICSFLGHTDFYQRLIKVFSKITKPLTGLLVKDDEFIFDEDCLKAFEHLKNALITVPIMQPPDWSKPFEIMCDASDYAIGVVLGQRKDKKVHVIYYASRTLDNTQMNYVAIEKELLVIMFAFDTFCSYLVGAKVTIYTDHAAIRYLLNKKDAIPILLRWILLLQEFDLEIKDKKGTENVVVDHLFRIEDLKPEQVPINDDFPYDQLVA
ncbi:uncharacterized protein LOC127095720 [Lathyrus oleraceus]|uniref:uncharacterized protein LOC127095720 n=1 Tax=Pisum sativum TaxID=3888 RepID=UPI0021D2D766|nr:uncharacterized protein LOC127095720 [Pisum sativum]